MRMNLFVVCLQLFTRLISPLVQGWDKWGVRVTIEQGCNAAICLWNSTYDLTQREAFISKRGRDPMGVNWIGMRNAKVL